MVNKRQLDLDVRGMTSLVLRHYDQTIESLSPRITRTLFPYLTQVEGLKLVQLGVSPLAFGDHPAQLLKYFAH